MNQTTVTVQEGMITNATLLFLRNLKTNNTREWFEKHKEDYRKASSDLLGLTAELLSGIAAFDREVGSSGLEPYSCIMRIHRDVRFSADKTPYKTNFFVFINRGGKKSPFGGYFAHIEPEGRSFAGAGVYMPEAGVLQQLRSGISGYFPEWSGIIADKSFRVWFPEGVLPSGILKRPPKGYDPADPAIEFLKYKGYYTRHFFSDAEVTAPDFTFRLLTMYRTSHPMVGFLNRIIG